MRLVAGGFIPIVIRMMDALSTAERLAFRHREQSAAIYATSRPVSPAILSGTASPVSLTVLLDDKPAPEGATFVTSVTRRPCAQSGSHPSMAAVVEQVLANLPAGVELQDRAVIEYYPARPYYPNEQRSVFCYEFISTEGLNVATWIPDISQDGAQMQLGFEGRGRPWRSNSIDHEPTERIGRYIARARMSELAQEVVAWWEGARRAWRDTSGDGVPLFAEAPEFVTAAVDGEPNSAVAALAVGWWAVNEHILDSKGKFFDAEPRFVELAKEVQGPVVSAPDSEPARRRMRP